MVHLRGSSRLLREVRQVGLEPTTVGLLGSPTPSAMASTCGVARRGNGRSLSRVSGSPQFVSRTVSRCGVVRSRPTPAGRSCHSGVKAREGHQTRATPASTRHIDRTNRPGRRTRPSPPAVSHQSRYQSQQLGSGRMFVAEPVAPLPQYRLGYPVPVRSITALRGTQSLGDRMCGGQCWG
jgi:hypothetical protein